MLIAVERLLLKLRQPATRATDLIELHRRLREEVATPADPEEAALARAILAQKQRVASELGAVTSCGSCAKGQPEPVGHYAGGACCSGVTNDLFDANELGALVHAGTRVGDLRAPRTDHAGCAFRAEDRCTLELAHRPARCVHYVCDGLRRELHAKGRLDAIERELAELNHRVQAYRAVRDARVDRQVLAPLLAAIEKITSA